MKKYNLSNIMKRAWELVKKAAMKMSDALRKSWKEAKKMVEKIKFMGRAEMLREGSEKKYSESCCFYFNLWKRPGKERIYINDYKGRSLGYINVASREICDAYNEEAERAAERFMEVYSF